MRLAERHLDGKGLATVYPYYVHRRMSVTRKMLKEYGVKKSVRRKLLLNSLARLKKYIPGATAVAPSAGSGRLTVDSTAKRSVHGHCPSMEGFQKRAPEMMTMH